MQFKCQNSSILTIQFSTNTQFKCKKPVLWRKHGLVLFNTYIGPLSGATTPGQSGPGSNGNKRVLHIPLSSSITGTSPLDCLMSYQDTRGGVYPSAEVRSVYSTAPVDNFTYTHYTTLELLNSDLQCIYIIFF